MNVLIAIQVSVASGGRITWDNQSRHKNLLRVRNIEDTDIQLLDLNDNLLNFNNVYWLITMRLSLFKNFHFCSIIPSSCSMYKKPLVKIKAFRLISRLKS